MKTVKTLILVTALLVFATPARAGEAVQEEARQGATQEAPVVASDETQEAPVVASDETQAAPVAASDETQAAPVAAGDALPAAIGSGDGTVAASDEKAVFEIGEFNRGPSSNLMTCNEGCASGTGVCNADCRTVAGRSVCVGDGIICCLVDC